MAYLAAAQVRYPVGSAWTAPTQLVFVPMLLSSDDRHTPARDDHVASVVALDRDVARRAGDEIICAVQGNLERAAVDQLKLGEDP